MSQPFYEEIDFIIPVPLSLTRRIGRGYNQAGLLAQEMSKHCQKPLLSDVLKRSKITKPQFLLSKRERLENLKDSFTVKNADKIKGKTVLLVDDIITSGATVSECAGVLKSAGAKKIYAMSLARD